MIQIAAEVAYTGKIHAFKQSIYPRELQSKLLWGQSLNSATGIFMSKHIFSLLSFILMHLCYIILLGSLKLCISIELKCCLAYLRLWYSSSSRAATSKLIFSINVILSL